MKTLLMLASVGVFLFLAAHSKVDAQKRVSKTPTNTAGRAPALPVVFTFEGALPTFSPNSRFIASADDPSNSNRNITRLWDTVSGQLLFSVERRFAGFSPDSRFFVVSNDFGDIYELREISGNRTIRSWKGGAVFSPDSNLIAAYAWDNTGKHTTISETVTGKLLGSLDGEFPAFSNDGNYVAVGIDDDTDRTLLWDVGNRRSVRLVEGKLVGFSRDSRLISTKTKTLVKTYETESGQLLSSVECWGEAFLSPDGQVMATEVFDYKKSANDTFTKLWEIRTGRLIGTIDGKLSGNAPFSSGGQLIATETNDSKGTKIWDATSGKFLRLLAGGFRGFSSDGQLLKTEIWWQGTQHSTKVYRSSSTQIVAALRGYPGDFSPDGQLIVTGTTGSNARITVWKFGSVPSSKNQPVKSETSSSEANSLVIGSRAVWNPPNIVWGRMQEECSQQNGESPFVDCIVSIMKQAGASAQAIEFTKLIKGEGYMDSYREMGKVDLATVFDPFRANSNGYILLLNGTPQMINPEDLEKLGTIDIRKDPLYPSLARKFPEIELWPNHAFGGMQKLPAGGQRFIINYVLLNGCHACAVAGNASVAFDFDGTGKFVGIKLLRLSRAAPGR